MESQSKILWITGLAGALIVLALILQPRIEEELAPDPIGALVAIEVDGSGVASVAPATIEVGQDFQLYAVLEARERSGDPLYYTQAKALRIDGRDIPAERIRPWDRPTPVRVRWLTLEGSKPYLAVAADSLKSFEIKSFVRTTWPISWSVPGELEPAHDDHLAVDENAEPIVFGTQRYQVQIEFYESETSVVPRRTFYSPGVDALRQNPQDFPAVRKTLPGNLAPASKVFGLTQLEPPADAERDLLRQIDELAKIGVAFSRLTVIRDQVRATGQSISDLDWVLVDLSGDWSWNDTVHGGDLLRAGERLVILYEDRGMDGVLDGADLCFDFVLGAAVRRLDEVFSGDGALELGPLTSP